MTDSEQRTVVPWLGPEPRELRFEAHPDDDDVRAALARFLDVDSKLRDLAEPHLIEYCRDICAHWPSAWAQPSISLEHPGDIWKHVTLGGVVQVSRRADGDDDDGIYFLIECGCAWEEEHGLQLVVRDGRTIAKVGGFDGHLTNTDAFGNPDLVGVVYVSIDWCRAQLSARRR